MTTCIHTKLAVPECCCNHCIERQLSDFAPEHLKVQMRRGNVVPLPIHSMRSREMPSVAERLSRPSL